MLHSQWQKKDASRKDLDKRILELGQGDAARLASERSLSSTWMRYQTSIGEEHRSNSFDRSFGAFHFLWIANVVR